MSSRRIAGAAISALALAALTVALAATPAAADKISHPTAVFNGLDKITGRIISFEVAANETVQFGSLQITERACYTRPATEAPQTIAFAQVDEIDAKKQYKRIFSGWMFAASPGLNGIEHPVYDIWLTDCKGGAAPAPKAPETTASAEEAVPPPPTPEQARAERKRKREERAAARRRAAEGQNNPDAPMDAPRPEPNRAPPARSFYPDAAEREPGGFY